MSFWDHVERKSETECWEWAGAESSRQFAQLHAYTLTYGEFTEEGLKVYTHCANDLCCNPLHLFTGYAPLGPVHELVEGQRVLVTGLLHKPHTGKVRNRGRRDLAEFLGRQDFTMVDIDLPNNETVAHQFFLDDNRLTPYQA